MRASLSPCFMLPRLPGRPRRAVLPVLALLLLSNSSPQLRPMDSPLTSTPFHDAYTDVRIIRETSMKPAITEEVFRYLTDSTIGLNRRLALVNALGWGNKAFAARFARRYRQREGVAQTGTGLSAVMPPGTRLCFAYLTAMCDYHHPERGLAMIGPADYPGSHAARIVIALMQAQAQMERTWPLVHGAMTNPANSHDYLRPNAQRIILNYAKLYRDD